MKTIQSAMGLLVVLALTSGAGANQVANGDFEGGWYSDPTYGYSVPDGWSWYPYPSSDRGRIYKGLGMGVDDSSCVRVRLLQNVTGKSVMYQVIDTMPGESYAVSAQWKLANPKPDIGNPIIPWIGAFFFDGGIPGDDVENRALIDAFVPNPRHNEPLRSQYPYVDGRATDLILPPNREIVAEHAYLYGYDIYNQLDDWETIYDAAGGAGEPSMPGIGESAANGGGAAWQTKVATGNHMIVGFFILDAPTTTGGGSDLYVDNVVVTPEPVTLVLLALGAMQVVRRHRRA